MGNILDKFKEVQEEKKEIDASKKLRVGIIGTGWIAEPHATSYMKMPDVEIVIRLVDRFLPSLWARIEIAFLISGRFNIGSPIPM